MSWGNRIRGNPQSVQKLLDENAQLIQAIVDYQNKGKAAECIQYQQLLHKNLMYLASLADSTQNIQAMIPPAPTPTGVPSTTPVSGTMGVPSGNVPVNIQDRKILPGTSMDQGSTAIPNMTSQVISSAGSPMTSTMHTAPQSMTTVQVDGTGNTPTQYGGNASMSPSALDNSTTTATGYPSNVPNQMIAPSMGATNPSIPGQQQNYMPNMHATRLQQQGQQFMMQQGVAMGYNRPPVQMHSSQQGHPQQPINQPYIGNQGLSGQSPHGMAPYQQGAPSYDPYPIPPHMNAGYNNPYVPQ